MQSSVQEAWLPRSQSMQQSAPSRETLSAGRSRAAADGAPAPDRLAEAGCRWARQLLSGRRAEGVAATALLAGWA